jgi:beta-lactamase regulating signal transducer with metallopeptidase domain
LLNDVHINFPVIAGTAYLLVAAVLLFRFLRNIVSITRRKRQGIALSNQGIDIILMKEKITPHSFGKYIFINMEDYENTLFTKEIIIHESSHIKQCHFLDVIFVELLIIFFWFNPMLYFYRNKIKQNHEFLADKAVIRKNNIKEKSEL